MPDRVLALNVGSSSLKWSLFERRAEPGPANEDGHELVDGAGAPFDSAGEGAALAVVAAIGARVGDVDVVAHRVVHGGERFHVPAVVDRDVRRALDELLPLADLHMRPALAVLDAARARWERAVQVVAFDTAFHATLSDLASTYAVPRAWREEHGVRRYGFHGLSVAYAASRAPLVAGRALRRMLVLHLGGGASATAVLDGRSVDTTMGMTPVEGIVMGKRSGSVDPGALVHLLAVGVDAEALAEGLERHGGLMALAGTSDMREIVRAASAGDGRARFARAHFVRSAAKHASSLLPALGGLDGLVFTGGIGEHDAELRAEVASALAFAGIDLDPARNAGPAVEDRVVSQTSSAVAVLVVRAREDISLLRAARQASCTTRSGKEPEHASSETNPGRHRLQ